MSDYARNLDTYNDGAAEEPCEFCGTYTCICPVEPEGPEGEMSMPDIGIPISEESAVLLEFHRRGR